MKKFFVIIVAIFISTFAFVHTINWHVGDQIISSTTCDSGDNITPPTAPTKYGYTFSAWGAYQQLEYIESTGSQWIDTGVTGEGTLLITAQGIATSSGAQIVAGVSALSNITWFGHEGGATTWLTSSIPYTTKINAIIQFKDAPATITINNNKYTWLHGSYRKNETLCLFGLRGSYGSQVRIFSATFIQNGLTVRDLIPCRRITDNVLGMYDTISGTFFTNSGSGNFFAGPVVGTLGAE